MPRFAPLFILPWLFVGCVSTTTTVISLQDIDCASCGNTLVKELSAISGVKGAAFNRKNAELTIRHDPSVAPAVLMAKVDEVGWPAELGPGKGRYARFPEFPPGADVQWVTRDGSRFELADTIVAGKITVVDFGAPWCRPCREADEFLAARLRTDPSVALRKVNVVDWDTEVVAQHLKNVRELPYFVVFDQSGREVARLSGFDAKALTAALGAAPER